MSNLYAVHDWSPDWGALIRDAGMTAWAVISESIGDDPNDRSGHDYSALAAFGVTPIVRLNYSHHGQGTIPLPHRYDAFAQRCANFVSASPGCRHWIIANETNWSVERPGGVAITPRQYANCFDKCQRAIKYRSAHHHVIVAAVAPYNVETGPWLDYWREMLLAIAGDSGADGLALHFYSRGTDPASIHSDTKMDAPFGHLYNGFRAYRDLLAMVPDDLRHLPAYATETNQMQPWAETNSGWVQAAYAEINEWNADPSHQPIKCLALYRWETYDQFGIRGKQGVIDDFRGAIGRGYQSPPVNNGTNAVSEQVTTHLPTTPHDAPATAPQLPPRQWDERLTQRGVTVETPAVKPGKKFWRVVKAQWFDEQEAGGRRHIYVEAITPDGRLVANEPFDVRWPSGGATESTKAGRGFEAGNFAMSPSLREFSVAMGDGVPSETVRGIGMGANGNPGIHTATLVTFQLTTMPQPTTQPAPTPQEPIIAPGPTPPQSATFYVAVRDGANLRAAPSVDAAKLTAAAYGQSLTVISATPNRDWLQVAWDGQTGWVLAALLSVEPPPPAPAPGGPTPPVPPAPTGIIDPMTALAFLQVESANAAFRDGLLVIRFEVHVFKTELRNDALFDMHFKFTPRNYADQWWRPAPNADWINAHGPMPERHKLLAFARGLNDTAALRSTGMGSAQVMGSNAARIGYATPQAMFNAFRHARYGVNAQVLGFVNYVLSDPALVDALRRRDWREMARRYNGISQVDVYAPLLEKALAEIGREVGA